MWILAQAIRPLKPNTDKDQVSSNIYTPLFNERPKPGAQTAKTPQTINYLIDLTGFILSQTRPTRIESVVFWTMIGPRLSIDSLYEGASLGMASAAFKASARA